MKNQNVLRILALVFAVAMMLTIASCDMLDKLLGKEPATTPEETTTEAPHEHAWGEPTETKAPTCTEKGENTYTCACGETKTEEIDALGHTEVAIDAIEATCTEAGKTAGVKCSVCEVTLKAQQNVAAKGHSYNEGVVTTQPTCTEKGVKTFSCANCTETYTEEVPALDHNYTSEVTTAATCTTDGVRTYTCQNDNTHTYTEVIPSADGHKYNDGEVTTAPTCTALGVKTYTCSACGETKTESVPMIDHDYSIFANDESVAASCFTFGKDVRKCVCGAKVETQVPYIGAHNYADGKCTVCNACQTHVREANGTGCANCDHEYEKAVTDTFGGNVVRYLSPELPERFDNALVLTVFDSKYIDRTNNQQIQFDDIGATNAEPGPTTMPEIHIYHNNKGCVIEYENVEVAENGVYELAIRMRIKDVKARGVGVIANKGTANETQEVRVGYDKLDEYLSAMDNDILDGTFFYGSIKVNLTEGVNTLTITYPQESNAYFYLRDIYLVKVADWTPTHQHAWSDVVVLPATCTEAGAKMVSCTAAECKATKTIEVIPATGHVQGELVASQDPNCVSQRVNTYKCATCNVNFDVLSTATADKRLNHKLDANNKCETCGVEFVALDLGFTLGKEWLNDSLVHLYNMEANDKASSSKVFKAADLPVGTIIQIHAGYDAKIDGWDVFHTGLTGPRRTARYAPSSYAPRNYWATKGEWSTQMDPTTHAKYGDFYFTIKREDGAALTADDLTKALTVLVPKTVA